MTSIQGPVRGVFPNSMAFAKWGSGPKTFLLLPGGPGNEVPDGFGLKMMLRPFRLIVDSGFTLWMVTRRRNMAHGHTIEDMARDYSQLIETEFDGMVDIVLGTSYGGIIAQYLAANHPDCFRHMVIAGAAYGVSDAGKDIDCGFAENLSQGKRTEAGTFMVTGLLPKLRFRWLARSVGFFAGRLGSGRHEYFRSDVLIEGDAEVAFDSREVLPTISVPVLLIAGDRDVYFPLDLVEETARLIPDCRLRIYEGKGHIGAMSDKRLPKDVLEFVSQ